MDAFERLEQDCFGKEPERERGTNSIDVGRTHRRSKRLG